MMRFVKYGVLALLALVIGPVGSLFLYGVLLQAETASFHRTRPILNSMNSVHDRIWTNDSLAARGVLLERFPIGTEFNAALSALKTEGFTCAKPSAVSNAPVDCQLLAPAVSGGSTRWIIGLGFDERDRLTAEGRRLEHLALTAVPPFPAFVNHCPPMVPREEECALWK